MEDVGTACLHRSNGGSRDNPVDLRQDPALYHGRRLYSFHRSQSLTGEQLILNLNTEGYTPRNLTRLGVDPTREDLDEIYPELSLSFIRQHPGQYLWFGVLKVINIFSAGLPPSNGRLLPLLPLSGFPAPEP